MKFPEPQIEGIARKYQDADDANMIDISIIHMNLTGNISHEQANQIIDSCMDKILKFIQIYGGTLMSKFREFDVSGDFMLQKGELKQALL